MSRTTRVAFAIVLVLSSGCTPRSPTPANPAPSLTPTTATLTAANPAATLPITPTQTAKLVRIDIRTLDNPARQAITLRVAITRPTGPTLDLGTVSPYPIDQPGSLTIALPAAAHDLTTAEGASLHITAIAQHDQAINPDLRLTLSATVAAT